MSKHYIGFEPSDGTDGDTELDDLHAAEADLQAPHDARAAETDSLAHAEQLAHDLAEIERAIVALRKAEPGLEPWAEASVEDPLLAASPSQPSSVWLVIGALWFLLVLVGCCAVVTVAHWTPAHAGMRGIHTSAGVTVGGAGKHRSGNDLQIKP
jgi:hypothetical protein